MHLLADENFPLPTIEALRQAGHDVAWARTDAPGAKDTALLDAAEQEGRILLTLDKDFCRSRCNAAARSNEAVSFSFACTQRSRRTLRPW